MTDFSLPQRMGLNAFLIIFIKIFRTVFNASVIYFVIKAFDSGLCLSDGDVWIRIIGGFIAMIGVSLLLAAVAYFPKKFYVKDGYLIFMHGLLNRETTTIPLGRIHSLRTKQGIWYRIFEMKGIVFDTLASKGAEIELLLDESEWRHLLHLIDNGERPKIALETEPKLKVATHIRQFGNQYLLLDAICQNHLKGMAILGGFLAATFERMNEFMDNNAADTIIDCAMSFYDGWLMSPLRLLLIVVVIYAVVLLLWTGRLFLRYSNMSMRYDRKLLIFTYGLLSRSSCRFKFGKVCTIWVKRNFFEKKLGLCTLMLRQALNVTAQKEEDNLKLYGVDLSSFFLKWWLGEDYMTESDIISARSGRGAFVHSFLPDLLISLIAIVLLCYFNAYVWLILPIVYLLISVVKGICAMRRSRIVLRDSCLVVYNGSFAEIENYMKYGNIEVVRIRRTPFTALSHRVTLILSTPGSTFNVRSLSECEAMQIYDLLLLKTESLSKELI